MYTYVRMNVHVPYKSACTHYHTHMQIYKGSGRVCVCTTVLTAIVIPSDQFVNLDTTRKGPHCSVCSTALHNTPLSPGGVSC